jgi:uncharacterized protein YukE
MSYPSKDNNKRELRRLTNKAWEPLTNKEYDMAMKKWNQNPTQKITTYEQVKTWIKQNKENKQALGRIVDNKIELGELGLRVKLD